MSSSLLLVYAGFPSAAAASLALRGSWRGAVVQVASMARLPGILRSIASKSWDRVGILGVGCRVSADEGRGLVAALLERGVSLTWYVSGYRIPWLWGWREPGLDYREVSLAAFGPEVMDWAGTPDTPEARQLCKWIAGYQLKEPGRQSELEAWVMAQIQHHIRHGDGWRRYLSAIKKMAVTIELNPQGRRQAERYRMFGEWDFAGDFPPLLELRRLAGRVGADPGHCRVLILGESGTGKELVARHMHECSSLVDAPFMAFNCATFANPLADSELFGHCRGAFTGADAERQGAFELADGGTLFLDEVGELPLESQAKLLRVLQLGLVSRLGETRVREVQVRVFSATNRDLPGMVSRGDFREDLYYRLAEIKLETAPLRDVHESDLAMLVAKYLWNINHRREAVWRPSEADWGAIMAYDWPGNVRQLHNVLVQAVVTGSTVAQILRGEPGSPPVQERGEGFFNDRGGLRTRDQVLRAMAAVAVEHTGGNRTAAAEALGVSYNTLSKYLGSWQSSG